MTFGEILANVYARTGYTSTPPSDVVTRIKASVNGRQGAILSAPGMTRLCESTTTITTIANVACYRLGRSISELRRIYDPTNDRVLEVRSQDWLRTIDPDQDAGTPDVYVPLGWRVLAAPLASDVSLWAVSTENADTGTVIVEGIGDGTTVPAATKALTGITRVAIPLSDTIIDILSFSVSAAQTGAVRLYDAAAAGNLLAALDIGETSARQFTVALWPTPSAAATLYADVKVRVPSLVQTYDEPMIPQDYHDLLEDGAVADEYLKQDDQRSQVIERRFAERLGQLKSVLWNPPGFRVKPGSLASQHGIPSPNLGAWYPRVS